MAASSLQIAFTESLAVLLLCTALLLLRNRQYSWLIPVLVTLALTRAIVLAFVPVLVVHGISRYRRRSVEPFPTSDRWRIAGLVSLGVAVTGLWPAIAAMTTGDPTAYVQTMSSWGPTNKLRILIEFPAYAWATGGALGLAALVAVIAWIAAIVLRRGARAWGPEVRAWAGFYPLYLLLAITQPHSIFKTRGRTLDKRNSLATPGHSHVWTPSPAQPIGVSGRQRRDPQSAGRAAQLPRQTSGELIRRTDSCRMLVTDDRPDIRAGGAILRRN
jgi:multisubunit Na+/H+ antiporter MnhB subunit